LIETIEKQSDGFSRRVKIEYSDTAKVEKEYTASLEALGEILTSVRIYDRRENVVKELTYARRPSTESENIYKYTYNESGNLIRHEEYQEGKLKTKIFYEYDFY
jgi:YD repeat-containing protein